MVSLAVTFSEKLKIAGAKTGGGDQKELTVAIIKATTSQFHVMPKEKHVRTLKLAVHSGQPRRNVLHIITELHRRLQDASDWLTALKTLITLHRLMRETEPSFMEELVRYSEGLSQTSHGGVGGVAAAPTRLFSTDNFVDRTKGEGRFDFSEWVRAYGKYLDEQLSVYATLRWYVEQEASGAESRMRSLPPRDLLFQLPNLQRLQRRLLDCMPRGAATHDPVVLLSLSLIVKESFKLYKAVSEGIISLADAFFEMELHDATRGLEYYKEGMAASDALSGYYATIEQLEEIKRLMQLPKLSTPPSDFLRSMEAYLADAPRPLPADGDVPLPTKKGAPLRKGKLLQSSKSSAPAAGAGAAPQDAGMVLPVPTAAASSSGTGQEVTSAPTSAVNRAGAAGMGQAADAGQDLLEANNTSSVTAAVNAPSSKAVPSPLDLLSDLDFSFGAPAAPLQGSGGTAGPGPAALSSNPFADAPPAPVVVEPAPAPLMQAGLLSNPFGEASLAAGGSSAGFGLALSPTPPTQPLELQQPQQPRYDQPAYAVSPAALPALSNDPFVNFGAPSPALAGGTAASAMAPSPIGICGDELSKAALHDPFASLMGLPRKNSPGAASNKPR